MAGQITISTLKDDAGVLATQNGMTGIPKAWVNFNGTSAVAIRASFNVSSITDNGTGKYTVNFTTAMPDANYAFSITAGTISGNYLFGTPYTNNPTTTALQFETVNPSSASVDAAYVAVAVFSS